MMKTKHFLLGIMAGLLLCSGCKKEEEDTSWEIVGKNIVVPNHYNECYIEVRRTNLSMTVAVDAAAADWCIFDRIVDRAVYDDGVNDMAIILQIEPNLIVEQRVALVTVSKDGRSEVVTITQEAGNAVVSVDHTVVELDYTAGTCSIPVTSNNASWTAAVEPAATWCTLTTASGKGNGAVTINIPQEAIFRRYTTLTVSTGALRDSVIIFQHGMPNRSTGVEIGGVTWAIRNVDNFGTFAPLYPQDPTQLFGKFYQFNRPVAYTATDPLYPEWDNTYPGHGNWTLINDPCPGGWRVPSTAEYQSLVASGWYWVTAEESEFGVPGTWFGPSAQNIPHSTTSTDAVFFPAATARVPNDGHLITPADDPFISKEEKGWYWTNEDDERTQSSPVVLSSKYANTTRGGSSHWWGRDMALSIRCVKR